MNKAQFIGFVKSPEKAQEKDVAVIKDLADTFPYCQIAHMLMARVTHANNSMHASEMLKKAATYASDRAILKKLIRDTPITAEKSVATESKVEKTTTSATKPVETAKPSEDDHKKKDLSKESKDSPRSNIAEEIQKTLQKSLASKKIAEEFLKEEPAAPKIETKTTPEKTSISSDDEIKPEPAQKKKEPEKSEYPQLALGYTVYSSRMGNTIQMSDEYTTEYPFEISPYNAVIYPEKRVSKAEIIDEFIKKEPSISRSKKIETPINIENLADKSMKNAVSPATETLAKLYLAQGNAKKALKIYKELLLKNPEKSTYFAAQIEKIKR